MNGPSVQETLVGLDPDSLPVLTPRDEAMIALVEFQEAFTRYKHALAERDAAKDVMNEAESAIEYAEARLRRDTWENRITQFAREKNDAETAYTRLKPYIEDEPLRWEGDDS